MSGPATVPVDLAIVPAWQSPRDEVAACQALIGILCGRRRDGQEAGVWPSLHACLLARLHQTDPRDGSRAGIDRASLRAVGAGKKPAPSDRPDQAGQPAPPLSDSLSISVCYDPHKHSAPGESACPVVARSRQDLVARLRRGSGDRTLDGWAGARPASAPRPSVNLATHTGGGNGSGRYTWI